MNPTLFDNRDDRAHDEQLRREKELNDVIEKRLGILEKIGRQQAENSRHAERETGRENARQHKQNQHARTSHVSSKAAGRGLGGGKLPGASARMAGGASMGIAGAATIATAAVEAVKAAAAIITPVANIAQNSSLNNTQKGRSLGRVAGMGWLTDFADALDGTTESLRKLSEETHPQRMMQVQVEAQKRQVTDQIILDRNVANYRADVTQEHANRVAGKSRPIFDRSTVAGERQYQEAQILHPLEAARDKADLEAKIAQKHSQFLRRDIRQTELSRTDSLMSAEDMNREARGQAPLSEKAAKQRTKRSRWAYVNNVEDAAQLSSGAEVSGKDAENRTNELMQKRQQLAQADAAAAQAAAKAEEARTNIMRGQLQIMENRERKHTASAQTIGAMNPLEREMAWQSYQQFLANGKNLDALAPEQRQHVAIVNPDAYHQATAKKGDEFYGEKGARKELFGDDKSLDQRRRENQEMESKIDVKVAFDESMLAKKMAEALSGLAEKISADFSIAFTAAMQQLYARQGLANAQKT